jgi:hypothetical protein
MQPSQGQADNNAALAEKYNVNGIFPLVVILDKDGKMLGQTGYINASPEDILRNLIHLFTKLRTAFFHMYDCRNSHLSGAEILHAIIVVNGLSI